jgi:hypothetical protein
VEDGFTANDAADEIVELVRRMDYLMITDSQRAYLKRVAGAALANRFVFACLDDDPGGDRAVWVFAPIDTWANIAQSFTIPAPLEDFLPAGAMEIAEGVWMWEDTKNKVERAVALMAEGFIWDEAFQRRIDATQTGLIATLRGLMPPPQTPPAPKPPGGPQ